MILDELVLHNFGVYAGRQSIALAPPSNQKPIVLIGGLNGGGKTTFLDALQLVLYGKLAKLWARGSGSYNEHLTRAISRSVSPEEGAALELAFRLRLEGEDHQYRLHRSWRSTGKGLKETFEVWRDGDLDEALTETWAEHVEEIMPVRVSPLFFFDGEKIEQLADPDRSQDVLSTAIHSLLGLDLVDRLVTDLGVLERRKKTSLAATGEQVELGSLEKAVARLKDERERLLQEIGQTQNEIDSCSRALDRVEERFRAEGGELFERQGELEKERRVHETALKKIDERLRSFAAGLAPLLLVRELLDSIAEQDALEREGEANLILAQALTPRDRKTLQRAEELGVSKEILEALSDHLAADRRRRRDRARGERALELTSEGRGHLARLRSGALDDAHAALMETLAERARVHDRLDTLDRQLAGTPEKDTLAALVRDREKARSALELARVRHTSLVQQEADVARELEQRLARLHKKLDQVAEGHFKGGEIQRILTHSAKVKESMTRFREKVVAQHLRRIEALVLDSFRQLLRKQGLVHRLTIDPESYTLTLASKEGPLPPESLSAGERQLLAVSLLWGLARASGRPLPMVIDTPLGRLDSEHRKHLVERYFPYASHQVLLLSTDEEIDESYHPQLKPWVGREYLLDFDDQEQRTTVRKGYFF